ncbi:MAG: hypothetical protein HYW22_01565 [Candidatus Aenigmarchaeota archaeon]|nr:hypothetical protein [Candidatus Aenigmarchaeota archaeon]
MGLKGQLSLEYYSSIVIFVGVLAYLSFQLFQAVPSTTNALKTEAIRIDAYQISEILINDGGHPLDWDTKPTNQIVRLGLMDSTQNKTNLLSSQKISKFKAICNNNYNDVKNLLDIQSEFSISFVNYNTNENWVCKSPGRISASFNVTRIVSIDGNAFGELTIQVWKK